MHFVPTRLEWLERTQTVLKVGTSLKRLVSFWPVTPEVAGSSPVSLAIFPNRIVEATGAVPFAFLWRVDTDASGPSAPETSVVDLLCRCARSTSSHCRG